MKNKEMLNNLKQLFGISEQVKKPKKYEPGLGFVEEYKKQLAKKFKKPNES